MFYLISWNLLSLFIANALARLTSPPLRLGIASQPGIAPRPISHELNKRTVNEIDRSRTLTCVISQAYNGVGNSPG